MRKYKKVEVKIEEIGRLSLEDAEGFAIALYHELGKYCDDIKICGSIRRRSQSVKDVEIVCVPKLVPKPDLFGETNELVRHPGFVNQLNKYKCLKGDRSKGRYVQLILEGGVKADIFIANPDNYGLVVFQRTGPWDYVKVALGSWIKKRGFESRGGQLYNTKTGQFVVVPDEPEFFKITGVHPKHPAERMLGKSQFIYLDDEFERVV